MAKRDKAAGKGAGRDWKAEAKRLRKKVDKLKGAVGVTAKAAHPVSPLAPKAFPALPAIAGVTFASAAAGIKYKDRTDVMLAVLDPGTAIAGAFTRSSTRSACVRDCQAKLDGKQATDMGAAIIVNSGNSNAFTGKAGEASVIAVTEAVAQAAGVPVSRVFSSSTGVIGEPLPHDRIVAVVPSLVTARDGAGIEMAARAIMTTDTFPKGAGAEIAGEGGRIRIAGIAKGSGMIAPDMATMLVYIFTDAAIAPKALQKIVSGAVDDTFNAITVDSDTSTSDSLIVCATGQSDAAPIDDLRSQAGRAFADALKGVMRDLAQQVVRDGEGATKFVEIRVTGAETRADAHRVAMSIANSPLVKTAIAGEDPNWGRIVAAVGKSGAMADRDRLSIWFGDVQVARDGARDPGYTEADGAAHMTQAEIVIRVDLGLGKASRTVWTCDLTDRYIAINADYRS